MAFSVRITGISKDTGQAIFKIEPSWWDAYQLMKDERFSDSSHDAGYLDYSAKMSIEEMRELHEKYRVKVLNIGYQHFYPKSLKLEEALYIQSDAYSHFYVTVFEWESGF